MRKIKKGDTVEVMRGKDAGKRGEVLSFIAKANRRGVQLEKIVIQGINIIKKSQKPNPQLGIKGGIVEIEKPIDISNAMYIDKKTDKPTRLGIKIDEKTGKKVRYSKKSGEIII